jgi:hypothetical protein
MGEKVLLKMRREVSMLINSKKASDVDRLLSSNGAPRSNNCVDSFQTTMKGTGAASERLSARNGSPERKLAGPTAEIDVLRNALDLSRENVDFDIEPDLEIGKSRGSKHLHLRPEARAL